jgi:ketosteroid isomerase-like protein
MSTAKTVGTQLVNLCRQGKNIEAIETLFADNVVSVEAAPAPGFDQIVEGKKNVLAKARFWTENSEVHSSEVVGPFPHGDDKFSLIFRLDATMKLTNQRNQLEEVAVYHLEGGKIVREEFFFDMAPPC